MKAPSCFIDIGHHQNRKKGQNAVGDVFLSQKAGETGRRVCVLADGLGSGIKANVLGTLTATMAMKFVSADINMRRASEIIMSTLPVCSERRIGYSTFTVMDIADTNAVSIMEYENPPFVFLKNGAIHTVEKARLKISGGRLVDRDMAFSGFQAEVGDRIVFFTDGVSQSGIGTRRFPLGWGEANAAAFIHEEVVRAPGISARNLARGIVTRALANDGGMAKDDISCAVVHFRKPRKLLVMTGPPIDTKKDARMAAMITDFDGKKVICGGTTANIIARELGGSVRVDLREIDPHIPPTCSLDGVDLVTEGTITLTKTAELLAKGVDPEGLRRNAALRLLEYFLESDVIRFVVGTKINDAHQDPNLPAELDIRRNLIRRIMGLLETTYMKETELQFI